MMRLIVASFLIFCVLTGFSKKIGVLVNPSYCSSCNLNLEQIRNIDFDTALFLYSTDYSETECQKYTDELGAFDNKRIEIIISNKLIDSIRRQLDIPQETASFVYLIKLGKPTTFFDIKKINSKLSIINDLLKNEFELNEIKVHNELFISPGYKDICIVNHDLISLSYARNSICIVDSTNNLTNVLKPENLPYELIYKAYNSNDTTGYHDYEVLISSLTKTRSSLKFQFNCLNKFSDSSFIVLGTLYVPQRKTYDGLPSIMIRQELLLLEFNRNKMIAVNYLKTKPNSEISKDFFLNYTYYGRSFNTKGIDVAIEKDIYRGKKFFLIRLKKQFKNQYVKDKLYKIELPEKIKNDSIAYQKSGFFKLGDYLFFTYDLSSVYKYSNKRDKIERLKIKNKFTNNDKDILRCVAKKEYGFDFLLSSGHSDSWTIVRLTDNFERIDSVKFKSDCKVKSNVIYDSKQDCFTFRSYDDVVVQFRVK